MAQDIGLLLRGLGASFSNQVPQFRQELTQQQQMERQQREDEYTRQQRARQAQMQDYEFTQKRVQASAQDVDAALRMASRGDWEGIVRLGEDRIRIDQQLGGPLQGDMTAQLVDMARKAVVGDPSAGRMLTAQLAQTAAQFYDRGLLQMPEAKAATPIAGGNIMETTQGPVVPMLQPDGTITTVPVPVTMAPKPDNALADETKFARENIVKNVQAINTNLGTITTSFEKLDKLLPQMKSGNRAAINAGLMSVARLISPEAVNESDVQRYSGAGNEISVLYNFLQGKGVDMDQMLRIADPLNPATFNPETLMSVARSVTSASIPSLMAGLADQKNIAEQYQLSPQFKASYLAPNSALMKRVNDMMASLNASPPARSSGQPITFKTMREAEAAADIGAIPIGSTVNIVDASGRVIDSFVVEP